MTLEQALQRNVSGRGPPESIKVGAAFDMVGEKVVTDPRSDLPAGAVVTTISSPSLFSLGNIACFRDR
jgi:hypothetical protein